jgi:outer membrane protein TolC
LAQQQEFSLKQAQDYAVLHNFEARNAVIDIAIAVKKIRENLAMGLPQAEMSIGYTNFINLATQLIPAEFFGGQKGDYIEVQFGTKNNANFQAQLSQLVYSGAYFVGLKMAKVAQQLSELQMDQIKLDVKHAITTSYILCLVAERNLQLMKETIATMEASVRDSKALQDKGFMQETDVDKLRLLLSDLKTNELNAANQIRNAYSLLKFNMGLTVSDEIRLTDNLDLLLMETDPEGLINQEFNQAGTVGFKLMDAQENLARLQVKLAKTEYQPVVTAFLSQTENAQRNQFDFFDFNQKWFPTSIFGINIGIPIFSSGKRYYKVQQADLNYQKSMNNKRQVAESIALGVITARNNFQVSVETFRNKRGNFELAKKIYDKDQIRYKSGVISTTDLNQTYNQLLQEQGTYLGSMMDLFTKKTDLQKAYNQL